MKQIDERDVDPITEITRLAEVFLNVVSWGF